MADPSTQPQESNDGFTLVELMVVVGILAVLLAIAVPTLLGARGKGQETSAKASVALAGRAAIAGLGPTGDLSSATATALAGNEPALSYVDGATPSTGARVVSVTAGPSRWTGTARSDSGTCLVVDIVNGVVGEPVTTAANPCSAQAFLALGDGNQASGEEIIDIYTPLEEA
ncbi:MAG: type II secretion system protein [Acidimicrobiia bacterium]